MMQNKDFTVFILTHGRPDNVITYRTLKKQGYTGEVYFIVDNEDKTVDKYINNFGQDKVIMFDKKAESEKIDNGNNFDDRRTILYARNICFKIARQLGKKYFIELDDDYTSFSFRYLEGGKLIKNLDVVFDILLNFYKNANITSLAFSQGGDHIGGFSGTIMKRKCMNSFLCSTEREFRFIGTMNEDVNTYTTLGSRGKLFFTFTSLQLNQKQTQSQTGGITDLYLKFGTYTKSFTTVMMQPSSVRVNMMNTTNSRLHHLVKWRNTTPMIINNRYKKYV